MTELEATTDSARGMGSYAIAFGLACLALLTFGFVMLTSTCPAYSFNGDAFYFAKRQALWLVLGLGACALTSRVDYRIYRKYALPIFILGIVLLVAVLIFGKRINGAMRWLVWGPLRFQPSEFAKYGLVIILAFWLERVRRAAKGQLRPRIEHWWWGVFAPLSIAAVVAGLILVEPDLGTALLLGAVAMTLLWLAGSPAGWLGGIMAAAGAGVVAFLVAIFRYGLFHRSYQVQRILHWWREDDLEGSNYQQWISKVALGSGGVPGFGLGNSRMKGAYLPEAHTDFIFPIAGEELGLVATLAVVCAFCIVMVCGFQLVRRCPDLFGRLLGAGIVTIISLQAIINIAVVTDTIPNKGMPLPLISYGGSNLVMTLAALGVVLNIYSQAAAHFQAAFDGAAPENA